MGAEFFDEQADQSAVKSTIVTTYFEAWAKVMTGYLKKQGTPKIAYIDLFAGPGRYKSGAKSTPVMILETAIKNELLRKSLLTLFNDKEPDNTSSLKSEISKLPGVDQLKYAPSVYTNEVGTEIVKLFEEMNLVPTLFFVDPWGYKGLSLRLINSVLKDWGCECIFFFNYSRINMGLSNKAVQEHMEALFGKERAAALTKKLEPMQPDERELTIVEEICQALIAMGGKFVLPFCFKNAKGTRTKHHLIFVSKHSLGYNIMKRVMAAQSSSDNQGVPSFEYSPATKKQPFLFELTRPLDELEGMLLDAFAGETLTMEQVYERHNYGRRYIDKNYKTVLTKLEREGKLKGNPSWDKRPKRSGEITCADHVEFTFPKQKK